MQQATHPAQHIEGQLLDGVERIVRAPKAHTLGWALLALHLSRIPAPGVRAHHRRVAAAILDDAAARTAGQLFALANGDLALLFRPNGRAAALDTVLTRLFEGHLPKCPPTQSFSLDPSDVEATGLDTIRTLWPLPDLAEPARLYIRSPRPGQDPAAPPEPQANPSAIAAMDTLVQTGPLADLMHRQTAILLRPPSAGRPPRFSPIFREVAISTTVLEAQIAAIAPHHQATADPFLFSHLAARLDRRMLQELARDIPEAGLLSAGLGPAALHVNLTVAGILSPAFAAFADATSPALAKGLAIGIEIPFVEALADINTFIIARERLRLAGMHPVLDGLTHHALPLLDPLALQPTLVKLNWCPTLPHAAALPEAIGRLGPDHLVLHRTETEAALAWGLRAGIQRFQGRYVDAMLAAARMQACPHAVSSPCRMRQCAERAAATGSAGRRDCRATPLLDGAAPPAGLPP